MQSLRVNDGDLVIDGGDFGIVEGPLKVQQDLGLAAVEPYGDDRFHPRWGSILDNYIGTLIDPDLPHLVESEIRRVVQNYVALQQALLTQAQRAGQPPLFTTNEVVISVQNVTVNQVEDKLQVRTTVGTLATAPIPVVVTVGV